MAEKTNIQINLCGINFKNPVFTASGTFGSGKEYSKFIDLNKLGAITVKGVSPTPWKGNSPSRIAETYGGMLNSVGLQNSGVDNFIENDLPFLRQFDTKVIVNAAGHTIEEYCMVVEKLQPTDVDMIELNISCPNVAMGGQAFGTDPKMVTQVVSEVKKVTTKPVIVKLSPNVTDITETAKAAEYAGADAISLINTLQGMKIDIHKRACVLDNKIGGLSGPAIKPVAVKMVYQVKKAVKIPIIGMGGICCAADALEFIMAGANAVAVGMANFSNPSVTIEIIEGIEKYLTKYKINDINELVGIV